MAMVSKSKRLRMHTSSLSLDVTLDEALQILRRSTSMASTTSSFRSNTTSLPQIRRRGGPLSAKARPTGCLALSQFRTSSGQLRLPQAFSDELKVSKRVRSNPRSALPSHDQFQQGASASADYEKELGAISEQRQRLPDAVSSNGIAHKALAPPDKGGFSRQVSSSSGYSHGRTDSKSRCDRDTKNIAPSIVLASHGNQPEVSKEAAAAYWGITLAEPRNEIAEETQEEPSKKKPESMSEAMMMYDLAKATHLSYPDIKNACDLFRRFVDIGKDINIFESNLKMTNFKELLGSLCDVASASDLPADFVSQAFRSADKDEGGDISISEFAIWYSSFSFQESVNLTKEEMASRELAREFAIDLVDLERYRAAFRRYDSDGSGLIEIDEFRVILQDLLKIPPGRTLPEERIQVLWRMADSEREGDLNFKRFLQFYLKNFDDADGDDSDPLSGFYKSFRKV